MKYVISFDEDVDVLAFAEEGESEEGVEEEVPNPVLPEVNHMAWALGSFLVLWALMQFVLLPPLLKSREEREQKILADRQAAEKAQRALSEVQADYDASLAQARAEADAVVDAAREEAGAYRSNVLAEATSEAADARAVAAGGLDASRNDAVASMRGDVGDIAVSAASAVLGKNLDRSAQQAAIDAALSGGNQ